MASDVKVVINLAKPTTGIGFGYPLIFQGKATTAIAYTECTSIDDVMTAIGSGYATHPIYKAALLMLMQNTAPSKFAIMAATGTTAATLPTIITNGWRQLIVVSIGTEDESTISDISTYIETTDSKMYFASVASVSGATISGNERTVMLVHDDADENVVYPEAALVGATAGKPAGSVNYKNQVLKGLTPAVLSAAELTAIEAAHAMAFVLKAGYGVTSDGKTTSDEYIDIIDSKDFIIQNIEYQTQVVLIQNDKVPYDNTGIALLENVCVNVLREAANNGIIATNDEGAYIYSVNYLGRSETQASDRAQRKYIEGSFSFALAGAIDTVEINGTIEI
jgi:hypothetical protein